MVSPLLAGYFASRKSISLGLHKVSGFCIRLVTTRPKPCDRFIPANLAHTLRSVAKDGAGYMYTGEWGHATAADIERYQPSWNEPRSADFAKHSGFVPGVGSEGGRRILDALDRIEEMKIDRAEPYFKDWQTSRVFHDHAVCCSQAVCSENAPTKFLPKNPGETPPGSVRCASFLMQCVAGPTNRRLDASSPVEMGVTTNVGHAVAPDDSVLIHLVLTGNAEWFSVLMDRHLAEVRGRIRGLTRCTSDAGDIIQDVRLKVRTRMTRVAINETLQSYRKANRVPLVRAGAELAGLASPCESPLQACVRAELTERLKAAVEQLPAKHRQAVVLHNLQEMSVQETARELRATTPAVKTQLFRARAALSEALLGESGRLGNQVNPLVKR